MAHTTRTFRIFVSSTFSDLKEERNALQKFVFPRLRELCGRHGCRFQAIDLRWGVRDEAGLDQQTMRICLDEVGRSQRTSPRPNFILLLGDRYGWRPLPAEIPQRDFAHIMRNTPDSEERALLEEWYKRDDNACYRSDELAEPEPLYCLQPRSDRFVDFHIWESEIERPIRQLLLRGLEGLELTEDERRKYEASATEQEIAAGALQVPDAADHVFCFFREIEGLQCNESTREYVDLDERGAEDRVAIERLQSLKQSLKLRLTDNIHCYSAIWSENGLTTDHIGVLPEDLDSCRALIENSNAPGTLCVDVWRRLAAVIEQEIAQLEKVEPLEREASDHQSFGEERARLFVGRSSMLDAIAGYISDGDQHPFAVWGEAGSGKTALIAKAISNCKRQMPATAIMVRFIGATPGSSDGRSLMESLCRQITRIYGGDEQTIPSDYRELTKEFSEQLKLATSERPLILFLDALDQLSDSDHSRNLIWLPGELPPHVRMVVSTLPGECKLALERKLPLANLHRLDPMPRAEADELLESWLLEAGRTLQPMQKREVLDKFALSGIRGSSDGKTPESGMPLFLKLAFEEARRWKSYTPPVELADETTGIIRQLFARLSMNTNHGSAIVSRSLGYIAAAKSGLTEDEMLDVLACDTEVYASFLSVARHIPSDLLPFLSSYLQEIGEAPDPTAWLSSVCTDTSRLIEHVERLMKRAPRVQLPVALWSRLYFDLEPYLTERSADGAAVFSFYHRQLKEVVESEYLSGREKAARHAHLARYFERQELYDPKKQTANVRKLSELPYQQTYGEQWSDLYATLTDFDFLEAKLKHVAVTSTGKGENAKAIYGGVYELQEDYRRALEVFPSDSRYSDPQ